MSFLRDLAVALLEDLRGLWRPARLPADSELRGDPPQRLPPVAWRWDVGVPLCLAALLLYAWVGWLTTHGQLVRGYNIAFDLDSPRFVLLFAGDSEQWNAGTTAIDYRIKHPFLLALRLPGLLLVGLGLSPQMAVVWMLALAGALTVACAWAYLRLLLVGLLESVVLSVFFAGSCAQLFYATIIESYGFAALTIAFVHLAALMRGQGRWSHARGRFVAALVTFGVTSTNVGQAGLAELFVWLRRVGPRRALVRSLSYGFLLVVLTALGVMAAYPSSAPLVLDPLEGAKRVKWVGVLEESELEKGGLGRELETFAAFAFVAPGYVELPVEGGRKTMVDFREPSWTPVGWGALALWLALLFGGAACLLRDAEGRLLLGLYLACLAFNVVLHMIFQYRGSLFIVASHAHFPLFACAAGAAVVSTRTGGRPRAVVLAGMLSMTVLALLENGRRLTELLERFAA